MVYGSLMGFVVLLYLILVSRSRFPLPRESYVGVPRAAGRQNCTGARDTQTDPVLRIRVRVLVLFRCSSHPPVSSRRRT
jgi:hypothetical protein